MENNKKIHNTHWGISAFDNSTQGLPTQDISVIETPNYHTGQVVLGKFLLYGLEKGERCALITFDTAGNFLENFQNWDINFQKYLDSEQLILLNYNANFSNEVGLSPDYNTLFSEIQRLCLSDMPTRIGIQQVDMLLNLNNVALMNQSSQKLVAAVNHPENDRATVLGTFVQFQDHTHQELAITLQKSVAGYFNLEQPNESSPYDYVFKTKKLPWFNYSHHSTAIKLVEGQGFLEGKQREVA